MKKYKKTYAIYHLAEKHTVFYLGKTKVHVSFTGGIITKKGVTPATFTTTDPVVQLAIENSGDFKKGVIRIAAKYAMGGEVTVGVNPEEPVIEEADISMEAEEPTKAAPTERIEAGIETASERAEAEMPAPTEQEEAGMTAPSTNRLREGAETEADEAKEPTKAAPTQQTDAYPDELKPEGEVETAEEREGEAETAEEPEGLETVDASCKDVAKQYLQEHFGENPAKLRTRQDVQDCAARHGITFNFV